MAMEYVCDAPGQKTWFRIETECEAELEAQALQHAVDNHFRHARQQAAAAYRPAPTLRLIERDIGLGAHVRKTMPMFLTLRDREGSALATAMLPPPGKNADAYSPTVLGPSHSDPFATEREAIGALEKHFGLRLAPGTNASWTGFLF